MNFKSFIKKYGILCIVAVVFLFAIGYFAYDQGKNVIKGKSVDGKDVIVAMDGYDLTADELYEELLQGQYGAYTVYMWYSRLVANATIETTEAYQSGAAQAVENFKSTSASQYTEDQLADIYRSAGIKDINELEDYFITYFKVQEIVDNYTTSNNLLEKYAEENQSRIVAHILVKCEDPENPTAEEQAKMDTIDEGLANGTTFAELATEYSDDSSAANGGKLGYADKNTNYVTEFKEAMLALNADEMSDWVKTQYGYHRIVCLATDYETISADSDFQDAFSNANPALELIAIKDAGSKLDVTFNNEKIEEALNNFFAQNIGEE